MSFFFKKIISIVILKKMFRLPPVLFSILSFLHSLESGGQNQAGNKFCRQKEILAVNPMIYCTQFCNNTV